MGGKQKQAQRTKNNARPSNSGRSAELLGTSIPQFVSFSGLKETCFANVGFSLAPIEEFDSSVDSNFQLVLKKMNKKDSTTKLKALQEFTELVKNTESEALKAILPFWPRLYCILATDAEHRVREATHIAHHQVVTKAKRNLAPYLKQLAGPWFTSQYDTYPPASSAATLAFQDAFPANKLQDAIIFCQDEILNYIADNVTVHTAQTLSNPKTHSDEDSKAKYERVLIASLQGYALYLNKVPSDGVKKGEELNKKIISSAKFWKLARHEVGQVRAAWYSVLTALCQKASFLLDGEAGHVTKVVLGNLDENDPGVLSHVWEAALLTITTIENWWSYINVDELFLPKLWKVLRQAGQGNASVIYPNLLPLLSHLPPNLDIGNFYKNFFENMRTGITQRTSSSQSESRALSITLIECLQYAILKNQNDIEFCNNLIDDHLLPTLDWSLENGQAAYKTLFSQVSSLLQYWHRNRNHKDLTNYSQYFDKFWTTIPEIFERKLSTDKLETLSELISRQIEFLMCLKHTVKAKKQLKVKFSEDESRKSEQGEATVNQGLEKSYLERLNGLVFATGALYIRMVEETKNQEVLEHVISLVQEFESEEFLRFLSGSGEIVKIYERLVKGWMENEQLCSKAVVDLLFLTFKYLGEEDKKEIFNSFNQIKSEECLSWCIARCLSYPHHLDPVVQLWLHNDKVGEFFKKITQYELQDECSADLSLLLKQAFTETINGEFLISKKSTAEIISILNQCLLSPSSYPLSIDTCASFAAYISAIIYTEQLKLTHGDELLLALFTLGSDKTVDPETLSKDTLWEVNTAWQDAISLIATELTKNEFIELTRKISKVVDVKLFGNLSGVNEGDVVEKIASFVSCVLKANVYYLGEILKILFGNQIVGDCKRYLEDLCCRGEFLKGHFSSAHVDFQQRSLPKTADESVAKYFVWKSVVASVLLRPIEEWNEDDDDFGNEDEGALVKLLDEPEDVLGDLFYDLALLESVVDNCRMMRYFNKIEEVYEDFRLKLVAILSKIDPPTKTALQCHLQTNAIYKSWMWMRSFYIYTVEICEQPPAESYDLLQKFIKDERAISRLHSTQIFAPHLTYDNINGKMNSVEAIVTLRHLLHCQEIDVQIAEVFGRIEKLRNEELERNFYNINFTNWENVQTITEILRLCTTLIALKKLESITRRHWDFIVVSLGSCTAKLSEVKNLCESVQIGSFVCAIGQLFCAVQKYVDDLALEQPAHGYIDEWKNVFVQSITTDLVKTWLHLATKYSDMTIETSDVQFLQEFGKILPSINSDYIFKARSAAMPKWSKLMSQSSALLTSPTHCLQLWGYHMLIALSKGLIEVDSVSVDTNTPHEKGMVIVQFKELLVKTQEIVSVMLLDFKLGEDSCRVEPFTDSYTYTFAYLLIWDVLMNLCENASRELRFQYADWLKKEDLLGSLLNNIFKLLPTEVLHCGDGKLKPYQEYFIKKITLSLDDSISSKKLECLVCWVYASVLFQLPASVRQWWSNVEIRTSQIVERVTASYVSPQLCIQELTDVAEHETKFKNMIIKVHQSVRECVAVYTVDESQMELVIALPINYPLGGPDVQCSRQIAGTYHKQWLMQLKMCVLHQNGRIWDALSLWNNNLDKKFDGVEECYICFAVLHPGTYQLPKLSCKTCRKKFHAACLYKWFSTSNKSTCPICRNLF